MRYLSIKGNLRNFILFIILLVLLFFVQNNNQSNSDEQYKKFYRFNSNLKSDLKLQPAANTDHQANNDNSPKDLKLKSANNEFIEENFRDIKKSFPNTNEFCKLIPDGLLGKFDIETPPKDFNAFTLKTSIYSFMSRLQLGGSWAPQNCQARHRIALVLPYRDRLPNLNSWLYNMHPFLQRQEIQYTIFIVEQIYDENFNKGILMNAAFKLIFEQKIGDLYDCIFYHDVDMIPTGTFIFVLLGIIKISNWP